VTPLAIATPVLVRCDVDTACRATQLTFRELYDDLEQYITDNEQRWKHVMRVKRYHTDNNGLGGYGGDQCYLEGQSAGMARILLRNVCDNTTRAVYTYNNSSAVAEMAP